MNKLFTVFTFAFFTSTIYAQELTPVRKCAHNEMYVDYCKKNGIDPLNNVELNAFENELKLGIQNHIPKKSVKRSGPLFTIPVVFHVVHVGGSENISDAQLLDAINVINKDYRKLNSDTGDVIAAFKSIAADCEIEFRLAQKDAQGNCVSGITRTFSDKTYDGNEAMVKDVNMNLNGSTNINNLRFPHDKYLNVWVCADPNGAAGYTNGPVYGAIFPNFDGIWIDHAYTGSIGTSNEYRSRTLTHEIGHWLSLSHVWGSSNNPGCNGTIMTAPCSGDDNCTTDDGVADTPNTIGWTTCNLAASSCGSPVDNVQNYMEYTYCNNMFTEGQKTKMHTLLGLTVAGRNNLYTPANLTLTGVDAGPILCAVDFKGSANYVCSGDSLTFTDLTYYGATGWNYVFGGGTPVTSTLQNPTITYNALGTYDVGLIANDGTSYVNLVKSNYITVLHPVGATVPFSEGFESATILPNSDWMVTNSDGEEAWKIQNGYGSTGSKCMMLENYTFNKSMGKDILISKTFDLSGAGNVQINFKYAYKQRISSDADKLKVYVSNDCGQTWSLRKQLLGSFLSGSSVLTTSFYPGASDWKLYSVTNILAGYLTQGFMFKIEFESDKGNNVFIDDINLDINVGIDDANFAPIDFSIYPNPVTNQATIHYDLPISQNITITLKDVLGKQLAKLDSGTKAAGNHSLFIGENQLPSNGIYFVCLSNGVSTFTQKIVVQ